MGQSLLQNGLVQRVVGQRPKSAFRPRSYDSVRAAVACGFGFSILNMKPSDAERVTATSWSEGRSPNLFPHLN